MIALDARLPAWHELLGEDRQIRGGDPGPQLAQLGETVHRRRLARTRQRFPARRDPNERFQHERERQPEIIGPPRGGIAGRDDTRCRDREIEPGRQLLESRLVHQLLDELGVGDDEAESLAQLLAIARHQEQRSVFLIEQHGRLGLRLAESHQRFHELFRLFPRVVPGEHGARVA